jgi:uncharacterized protein (TIGR02453 family)
MNFDGILKFLKDLSKNNDRTWFEKNKPRYLDAKESFDDFIESLHKEILKFDDDVAGLNPRKLAFRIYRDVRFSADKRPYKTNMGAGMSRNGKMEQEAGYYVHIEPGKSFVAGGLYMPEPANLAKVRQEIDYNAAGLKKIFASKSYKKYFKDLDDYDKLKTAPKGYAKDHPEISLLQHKSFVTSHQFSDVEVKDKNFVKKAAEAFKAMKPLNDFLNEAIA